MKTKAKRVLAALGGLGFGAAVVGIAWPAAKPPAFEIVEYEITDPAGLLAKREI